MSSKTVEQLLVEYRGYVAHIPPALAHFQGFIIVAEELHGPLLNSTKNKLHKLILLEAL